MSETPELRHALNEWNRQVTQLGRERDEALAAVERVRELIDPASEMAVIAYRMRLFSEGDIRRALDGAQ